MSEQTLFDITLDKQNQWGQSWYSIERRAGELITMFNSAHRADYTVGATNCALVDQLADNLRRWRVEFGAEWLSQRWHGEREDGLVDGQAIFAYLQRKNFDGNQITHIEQFLRQTVALTAAYRRFFVQSDFARLENDETKTPLNYVQSDLMRKSSTDLRIAERALFQRLRITDGDTHSLSWQGYLLSLADIMAYAAIEPLRRAGLISTGTAAITYMQEETEIRLVPYYPILLIGIPSAVAATWSGPPYGFLAIPHEIGHYLFRFGIMPTTGAMNGEGAARPQVAHKVLEERLRELNILPNDWRWHWLEELFADAFGCLVAGPVSALGFQEFLADNAPTTLSTNSAKHPISALRPFIQTEMLRELHRRNIASYKHVPDLLDQHWQRYLHRHGEEQLRQNVKAATFTPQGQQPPLTGAGIIDALQVVLREIFTLIENLFPNEVWQPWSQDVTVSGKTVPGQDVVDALLPLQNALAHFYCHDGAFQWANLVLPDSHTAMAASALINDISTIGGQIHRQTAQSIHLNIPYSDWQRIFHVPGWSDEGGEAGHMR